MMICYFNNDVCSTTNKEGVADLAQLGERKTEVLEVPSSILGVGRRNRTHIFIIHAVFNFFNLILTALHDF